MKELTKKFIFVSLSLIIHLMINAQQSFVTTGSVLNGSGGNASISTGQLLCSTISALDGTSVYSFGVQQTYIVSQPTENIQLIVSANAYSIFPNPTTDRFIVRNLSVNSENAVATLYDAIGNKLTTRSITKADTEFLVSFYAKGIYFLKITQLDKTIQLFKIIKN